MPLDPTNPSHIFVQALLGETIAPRRLATVDTHWRELIQAAQQATPTARRATLILAKSGQTDTDRLLDVLRGTPQPIPSEEWPEPTPFGQPRLPQFPHWVLPHWLGNTVRAEARATQTPHDLAGLLVLAVLSTVCAGRVLVNPWGDWIEPLNLFLMVALPPGHRKSAVFANIVQPLQQYEASAALQAAPHIARARRARHAAEQALLRAEAAALNAENDDDRRDALLALVQRRSDDLDAIDPPVVPRLIVDDCSPERLAMLLHQQGGRIAILSPEGGIFDLIAGRYSTTGAPNLDHILKGHAGDPIIVDRVGRAGEIIPRPALTIGLTVQPEVLRGLAARPGFHGRGLLARFLYAVPNATLGTRVVDVEPVPESLRRDYRRQILALLEMSSRAEPACPTPPSSRAERACERSRGISAPATPGQSPVPQHPAPADLLPLSRGRERGLGGEGISSFFPATPGQPRFAPAPLVLPFSDAAADRLRDFAHAVEPRLAPSGDLAPIVDWASKLVGAVARISGLLHLAELAPDLSSPSPAHGGGGWGVGASSVDAAVILADYLIAHARAAYDAMGLDPALAQAPVLLAWLRRSGLTTFTRRDAARAAGRLFRSASHIDDALDELEHLGYIRQRPHQRRPGQGRPPGPAYDVHPSLVRP